MRFECEGGRRESGDGMIMNIRVDECDERMIEIGNTCSKKLRHTYEDVRESRIADTALMDYIVVSRYLSGRILEVNVLKGADEGVSDHYLVQGRIRVNENFC